MAYSEEEKTKIIDSICKEIEEGSSLRKSLLLPNMPPRVTFFEWIKKDKDKANQYARACETRQELIFEDIIDIADEQNLDAYLDDEKNLVIDGSSVQRSRLKVDARKWALSKMNPKKYGDKIQHDATPEMANAIINLGNGTKPKE